MEYKIIQLENKRLVECLPDGGVITDEATTLDLVGICGGEQASFLLLYASNLSDDFYDLKTGLAGQVLLKLSNYHLQTAAVIPSEKIGSGKFYEMVIETNRRNDFRVFPNREDAVKWFEKLDQLANL